MLGKIESLWWYILAGLCEIGGCFAFWLWLRNSRSSWWIVPGTVSLVVFAVVLTKIPTVNAGRAFAAYGGIYIALSILWLWIVERVAPNRWDVFGGSIAITGALIVYWGRR